METLKVLGDGSKSNSKSKTLLNVASCKSSIGPNQIEVSFLFFKFYLLKTLRRFNTLLLLFTGKAAADSHQLFSLSSQNNVALLQACIDTLKSN